MRDKQGILVIWSDEPTRRSLESYLREQNYRVESRASIDAAEESLEGSSHDLILLDPRLDRGESDELSQCGVPILALSVERTPPPAAARFTLQLAAPISRGELLEAVEQVLAEAA